MPSLEKRLKQVYLGALLRARYGAARPDRVRLAHSDHWIHLDPADDRAWSMIAGKAVRGICPRNQRFWREACARLRPGLALDVGANFGECLFAPDYDPATLVIAFEANAALIPWLQRSLAEHNDRDRIHIVCALAGDEEGGEAAFFVDRRWSGASTAAPPGAGDDPEHYERRAAPRTTVDAAVRERLGAPARVCVFKIDVEGYEPRVLAGMRAVLDAAEHALGLIEFDAHHVARAGDDPAGALRRLQNTFEVYAFRRDDALLPALDTPYESLRAALRKKRVHTDLLLLKAPDPSPARTLVREWLARTPGRKQPPRTAAP